MSDFSLLAEGFSSSDDTMLETLGESPSCTHLKGWDRKGALFRHAFELLQREQIRSPDHSLGNVASHLRHWRTLETSQGD
jgi:hypothetical protein